MYLCSSVEDIHCIPSCLRVTLPPRRMCQVYTHRHMKLACVTLFSPPPPPPCLQAKVYRRLCCSEWVVRMSRPRSGIDVSSLERQLPPPLPLLLAVLLLLLLGLQLAPRRTAPDSKSMLDLSSDSGSVSGMRLSVFCFNDRR